MGQFVKVPPLRDRLEDIPQLVRVFLSQMDRDDFEVPEHIMDQLMNHDWPGNVRELRNVVHRGLSLGTAQLTPADPIVAVPRSPGGGPAEMMDMPFKEAKGMLVEAFEKEYLVRLLECHGGNITRAAAEAGIDRNYIHRLVKKYSLIVPKG